MRILTPLPVVLHGPLPYWKQMELVLRKVKDIFVWLTITPVNWARRRSTGSHMLPGKASTKLGSAQHFLTKHTLCGLRLVVMFSNVFSLKIWLPFGLHSSCCINPTASTTFQKTFTKYHDWPDATQCSISSRPWSVEDSVLPKANQLPSITLTQWCVHLLQPFGRGRLYLRKTCCSKAVVRSLENRVG